MNIAKWLKDKKNNIIIPYTLSSCVFDDEGNPIDSIIKKGIGKEEIEKLEKKIPKKVSQLENDKNYISADSIDNIKILDDATKEMYTIGVSNGKFYIEEIKASEIKDINVVFNRIPMVDDITKERYNLGVSNGKVYIEKEGL